MWLRRFLTLYTLFAIAGASGRCDGISDAFHLSPFWNWKQLETKHFRITFPLELAETAQRAAGDLEEAHAALSKELYWEPSHKTQILVIDNVDSANGVTSPLGRFGIVLYVTPPDNWFSTAYYDDWLRLLCFHEYTHLLNIDATRGFWRTGRYLFGDVLLPNGVWPSWMLEGLAVYMETRFTRGGRGRSPYYEMILRAAVADGVLDTPRFFTLDRFNDPNVPYFPAGEAPYLFGYELMNEVAQSNEAGPTFDGAGRLTSGEDALGVMSYRSSLRFPWFINDNLENITGRDWYAYWRKLVDESRARANHALAVIRAQPVSAVHRLTTDGDLVLGSAFSPDGAWAAYTKATLDQRTGLYLRNLKTGESTRVAEKIDGAQVAFTPDSKHVLLGSLRRTSLYTKFSELGVYSLERKSLEWLTSGVRARDPDVSRDGKTVVFTMTGQAKTGLASGALDWKNGRLELRAIHELVAVNKYDVISTPKLSPDGGTVYYSLHRNGRLSEELMALDLASGRARTLVDNGHFNRYPTVDSRGEVYFVSDATGVDNLYRYREGAKPALATNLTTGIAFPSIDASGKLYGAVLSYTGWDLAEVDPLPRQVATESVTIAPPPAPEAAAPPQAAPHAAAAASEAKSASPYKVDDYSVVPSIWPRTWIPYAYVAPSNVSFGEAILGFDAVDRHRYLLNVGYDTLSSSLDWLAEYQNRTLGPTLTFVAENQFSYAYYVGNSVLYYTRDTIFSLGSSLTNLSTYSSLTPYVALTFDQTSYFTPNAAGSYSRTSYLPDVDALLSYSDSAQSKLAIGPESGRTFVAGGRYYINNGNNRGAIKGLLADAEYIRMGESHAVLSPAIRASYTSVAPATNPNLNSNVIAQGYYPLLIADPVLVGVYGLPGTSLSRLPLRGYPLATFYEKAVISPSLDFRFPIADVFRGWGTNPFYLEQLYGTVFFEDTYFPYHEAQITAWLPATGGGLTANLQALVQLPLSVSVEYQYGFQKAAAGAGDVIVDLKYAQSLF